VAAANAPLTLYRIEDDRAVPIPVSGVRGTPSAITAAGDTLLLWTEERHYGFPWTPYVEFRVLYSVDAVHGTTTQLVETSWGPCSRPGCTAAPALSWTSGERHVYIVLSRQAGWELWVTAGTPSETRILASGATGTTRILEAVDIGDRQFFTLDDQQTGVVLWQSDGTREGTAPVPGLVPAPWGSEPLHLTDVSGSLVFSAHDGEHGRELLRLGSAGPLLIADLVPGPDGSYPDELLPADNALLFEAASDTGARTLWVTDGTETGTAAISPIASPGDAAFALAGQRLFFTAASPEAGAELWSVAAGALLRPFALPERVRSFAPVVSSNS
jgi:ELWxxDGT repeat protein